MESELIDKIFSVSAARFDALALEIFRFQYEQNLLYRRYADAVHKSPEQVRNVESIPFLPIRFFKSHGVSTTTFIPEQVFTSSGTTGMVNSRHLVKDLSLYRRSFISAFESFYGPAGDWCILALLPSYLERSGSSLILMAEDLIKRSGHPDSGFYLHNHDALHSLLLALESRGQKTLLLGATFGLLDFAEQFPMQLKHTVVMETGGMKGRRAELTREELHGFLQQQLGLSSIHSEYGMTELLSQAYSKGAGLYESPPWMRVLAREEEDPMAVFAGSNRVRTGVVNIIDLANLYSCAFIATDDLGRLHPGGGFEVLGRIDNADIRGCSMLTL